MIIIQFSKSEQYAFENIFDKQAYESEFIESKKLDGDEILLQAITTTVSVVAPFLITFFLDQKKKKKEIKIIRKGVEMTFKNEKDLKKFLEEISSKKK